MGRSRSAIAIVAVIDGAVACGDAEDDDAGSDVNPAGAAGAAPVAVDVAARQTSSADPRVAGQAISEFGVDLFTAVRSHMPAPGNVTVSPASVAVALGMVEPGA